MSLRDDFLAIKDYEEYDKKREKFRELEIHNDKELLNHYGELLKKCGVGFGKQNPDNPRIIDYFGK